MQDLINGGFTGISSHGNTHYDLGNSFLWIARRVLFIPVLSSNSLIPPASVFLPYLTNNKKYFTRSGTFCECAMSLTNHWSYLDIFPSYLPGKWPQMYHISLSSICC